MRKPFYYTNKDMLLLCGILEPLGDFFEGELGIDKEKVTDLKNRVMDKFMSIEDGQTKDACLSKNNDYRDF